MIMKSFNLEANKSLDMSITYELDSNKKCILIANLFISNYIFVLFQYKSLYYLHYK